jgi:tRNA-dihydrouridine synthase B
MAPITIAEHVAIAKRHLEMEIAWKEKEILGVLETRRHYGTYFKGIPNFKEYRMKMVTSNSAEEMYATFDEVLSKFGDHTFA